MLRYIPGFLKTPLLLLVVAIGSAQPIWSQKEKKTFDPTDGFVSIGYQYANFGNSLSPNMVRMYGDNLNVAPGGNKFSNYQHGYGLVLRFCGKSENKLKIEFTLANKKVIADQSYSLANADSSVLTPIDLKVKTRIRSFSIGANYSFNRLSIGGSADIGMFASLKRYSGIEGDNDKKWIPWFSTPKILKGGYTGKTPVVGFTAFMSYQFGNFMQARIYKQFTGFGLGAELSGRYFSISNFGIELAYTIR